MDTLEELPVEGLTGFRRFFSRRKWIQFKVPLITGRQSCLMSLVAPSKILIAGGQSNSSFNGDTYFLNTKTRDVEAALIKESGNKGLTFS